MRDHVTYSGKLNLSGNWMFRVRVDRSHHRPVDAASWRAAIEERGCCRVDSEVPDRELMSRQLSLPPKTSFL